LPTIPEETKAAAEEEPDRCNRCTRRTGLMSFKCRCGRSFCGLHRLPEQHDCGFDHRMEGRKKLEASNPLVTAEKLERI
jgi:hypothetical protein